MFSRFFIHRPVFAWVLAIVIMLAGALSIESLPVAQYPDVAPPSIAIKASYPGASADVLENSVTQVIEQQLTGLDGLLYFSSSSDSSGDVRITATFAQGTNPDTAQVQVQNKVQQATTRLPTEVQQQGITVTKSQQDFLLIMALYDTTDKSTAADIADYMVSNLQDPLSRVEGVGSIQVFGSQYAMRIWMDPTKLAAYSLIPSDISSAIEAQNTQVSAGKIGAQPANRDQQLTATVTAQSRLKTPEQFRDIIVKSESSGALVHLGDVARVELGNEDYTTTTRLNGHPAAGIAVMLSSGANALATAERVKAKVAEFTAQMPRGYAVSYPKDSTDFIKVSVEEVVHTLFEAILLVVLVMFLFLQNLRATLIPAVAVPVVLLGTFGVLAVFGYSINTLTLFGMVLAIGLLVDDAIVVVENVERLMRDKGLSPVAATEQSMREISSALVGVALVLSAVFLPMAFFGGSTGVIYRQFSITIVSSMLLSVVVALTLTPALCAALLKPVAHAPSNGNGFFARFNRGYENVQQRYTGRVTHVITGPWRYLALYGVVIVVMGVLFVRLPGGFLPNEDQGDVMVMFTLPAGATEARTSKVGESIEHYFLNQEKNNVEAIFVISGFNFSGSGQNAGMAFVALKNWSQRPGQANSSVAIAQRAMQSLSVIRDAQVFTMSPPAVQGLGQSDGFTFELQATGNTDRSRLLALRNQLLVAAAKDPRLAAVRPNDLEQMPQLQVDLDYARIRALGLSISDVTSTLSSAWGSTYVNDFIDRGRVKKVYIQGDAESRGQPSDLDKWFVRGTDSSGNTVMTPFSSFASTRWSYGPESLSRYNGLASYEIQGTGAPGVSSGKAMDEMEALARALPAGTTFAWSELSYQERLASGQAMSLYVMSILVVFLCLAALYESWSIPFSVMLVIPLGVVGAVLAATMRGLENDVYFQVALLTTIGLSAKNAILIVEFAEAAYQRGATLYEAALEGASTRLRPVLMTSLAFIAGVFPLAIATGAGANSRISIGSGIVGGTLTATVLAIFLVPMFFVMVRRAFPGRRTPAASSTVESASTQGEK
ncbi:efflux RND transporter permease subunit [Dickeya oryzae]|uniref:efflux RND transporter permease subunit n=1 Tax=Dickeya oryzae TaxID=1240404 RepID=UPI001AECEB92|nr:efflux RND transporter permease subunit [Dickeya oryzae]MBP2848878.1 efflux RND transporter permease subunit [Dickeya oryzae]